MIDEPRNVSFLCGIDDGIALQGHEVVVDVLMLRVFLGAFLKLLVVQHFAYIFDYESLRWYVAVGSDSESFCDRVEDAALGVVITLELLVVAKF